MKVRISAAWARVRFQGCSPDYIRDVCHGQCCESPGRADGSLIPVTPAESAVLLGMPGVAARVENGFLRGDDPSGRCPFHNADGLCDVHACKPINCRLSPFVLHGDRLHVRHRYVFFRCHTDFKTTGLPAYRAFAASLVAAFGDDEAARITAHFDGGGGDVIADMRDDVVAAHRSNEANIVASA